MIGEVVADVRRVLRGDAERALVHAVDDAGLEYKIEVPAGAVLGAEVERGAVLRLVWSIEPASTRERGEVAPRDDAATEAAATEVAARVARASLGTPAEVDAAFMALMGWGRVEAGPPSSTATPSSPAGARAEADPSSASSTPPNGAASPERELAAMLGITPR
ncbi:MAG: hypothetical protein KC420_02595 [Myxococcales bacterium]|nr:hypothetical protein [Myxococcales bacterium]MCB9702136.1 hypothetical protein [Myxococcales bacterium]